MRTKDPDLEVRADGVGRRGEVGRRSLRPDGRDRRRDGQCRPDADRPGGRRRDHGRPRVDRRGARPWPGEGGTGARPAARLQLPHVRGLRLRDERRLHHPADPRRHGLLRHGQRHAGGSCATTSSARATTSRQARSSATRRRHTTARRRAAPSRSRSTPTTGKLHQDWVSLNGTDTNCAGMPTPWGTWLTCEETTIGVNAGYKKPHGYVFEVDPHERQAGAAGPYKHGPHAPRGWSGRPRHRRRLHDRGRRPRRLLPVRARQAPATSHGRLQMLRVRGKDEVQHHHRAEGRQGARVRLGHHRRPGPDRTPRTTPRPSSSRAGPRVARSSSAARAARAATARSSSAPARAATPAWVRSGSTRRRRTSVKLNEHGDLVLLFESHRKASSTAPTTCAPARVARSSSPRTAT